MDDTTDPIGATTDPGMAGRGPGATPLPEPGETRRTLERAPGERYVAAAERRAAHSTDPAPRSAALGRGLVAALAGAAVITFLGGPLSVTLGLVVVAAFIGWLVASLVRPAAGPAVGLAIGSVALGLVGIWLFAGLEGGALGLVDYLGQVHGPLVLVHLAAAGLVAFGTIR